MAMGREGEVQGDLMMTWAEIRVRQAMCFTNRLQQLLAEAGFDAFVEETCKPFYGRGWARRRCRRAAISACI